MQVAKRYIGGRVPPYSLANPAGGFGIQDSGKANRGIFPTCVPRDVNFFVSCEEKMSDRTHGDHREKYFRPSLRPLWSRRRGMKSFWVAAGQGRVRHGKAMKSSTARDSSRPLGGAWRRDCLSLYGARLAGDRGSGTRQARRHFRRRRTLKRRSGDGEFPSPSGESTPRRLLPVR